MVFTVYASTRYKLFQASLVMHKCFTHYASTRHPSPTPPLLGTSDTQCTAITHKPLLAVHLCVFFFTKYTAI